MGQSGGYRHFRPHSGHTLGRIQGISLEFLVAGAVASVNVPVVVEYAAPLLIQQFVMVAVMLFMNLWLARRVFSNYWF